MKFFRCSIALVFATFHCVVCSTAWGQEAKGQEVAPVTVDSPQVRVWIDKLNSKRFAVRNKATSELLRGGHDLLDVVEAIAASENSDAADRAFGVLEEHYLGSDQGLREAAGERLKRIAGNETHPRSKAADRLLNPPAPTPQRRPGGAMVPPQIFPPAMRNMPQGNRSVSISVINGKRSVKITENGEKTHIVETDKGIEVKRTDQNGKVTTKNFDDIDDLKKGDADAHKKFSELGGGINIQGFGFGNRGPAMPPMGRPFGNPFGADPFRQPFPNAQGFDKEIQRQIDDARQRAEQMRREHLERSQRMREESRQRMQDIFQNRLRRPGFENPQRQRNLQPPEQEPLKKRNDDRKVKEIEVNLDNAIDV